ncbi:MAG: DUF3667 domain-containing protein [Pseudoflavonifractor sp.]|nr:DUF3667 domain-containing protein [Pseudoflavonifractor sp.]
MGARTEQRPGLKVTRCLNCGHVCGGKYCPECGQPTSTGRLDNGSFLLGTLRGLLRVNNGFFFTAWNLLVRPWAVIRDYAAGRRIRYLAPVAMLIVMCLIRVVEDSMIGSTDPMPAYIASLRDDAGPVGRWFLSIAKFLCDSPVLLNLTLFIPAVIAVPLVFRRYGATRYNAAEYLMAMMYMIDAFLVFDAIVTPVWHLFHYGSADIIGMVYAVSVTLIALNRTFNRDGTAAGFALHLLLYLLLTAVIYMLLFGLIAVGLIIVAPGVLS